MHGCMCYVLFFCIMFSTSLDREVVICCVPTYTSQLECRSKKDFEELLSPMSCGHFRTPQSVFIATKPHLSIERASPLWSYCLAGMGGRGGGGVVKGRREGGGREAGGGWGGGARPAADCRPPDCRPLGCHPPGCLPLETLFWKRC